MIRCPNFFFLDLFFGGRTSKFIFSRRVVAGVRISMFEFDCFRVFEFRIYVDDKGTNFRKNTNPILIRYLIFFSAGGWSKNKINKMSSKVVFTASMQKRDYVLSALVDL